MATVREFLGSMFGRGGKRDRLSVHGMGGVANRDVSPAGPGNQAILGQTSQRQSGEMLVEACGPGPGCNYPQRTGPAPTPDTLKIPLSPSSLRLDKGQPVAGLDQIDQVLREIAKDRSRP